MEKEREAGARGRQATRARGRQATRARGRQATRARGAVQRDASDRTCPLSLTAGVLSQRERERATATGQ
eukprot:2500517-Pleurochrysis_carterae.AAC.1